MSTLPEARGAAMSHTSMALLRLAAADRWAGEGQDVRRGGAPGEPGAAMGVGLVKDKEPES
jgi:hypothetical protein